MALSIVTTEQIAASPEAVWAFISDLQRIPEWVIGTKKMLSVSSEQAEAGTEYQELTQIGPSTSKTIWHITTFRAPHVQVHESRSALLDMVLTMTVEAAGDNTRLVHRIEGQMLPRVRPLGWLLELLMRRQVVNDMRRALQQAKQIIEREYGAEKRTPQTLQAKRAVPTS